MRLKNKFSAILLGIFMSLGLISILLLSDIKFQPPEVRKFSPNFSGVAIVFWGIPNHDPLPVENGKVIMDFSKNNIIVTSTKLKNGWSFNENYYIEQGGKTLPVKKIRTFIGYYKQSKYGYLEYTALYVGKSPGGIDQYDPIFERLLKEKVHQKEH